MLKILLSVAGVVFIGLGLFGGSVLEGFVGGGDKQTESMVKVLPSTGATVNETTPVAVASVNQAPEQQTVEVAAISNTTQEQSRQEQMVAEVTAAANASGAATIAGQEIDSAATETDALVEVGADGAEPIAPAQAAGDLIAMAEQAKSSSRNEQVDIANTVLASNTELVVVETAAGAETETLDKSAEVESVIVSTTGEVDSDELVVVKDRVNLREGPSINHPIVLTLDQGHELMEFKREGKWVHVGAFGTSGKIGWVHERLVGPAK